MSQPSPLSSHPTNPSHHRTASQTSIVIPALKHTATRLQCLANYKLRLESSRNEPRLKRLLGHISIHDNICEYRREELTKTACPYPLADSPLISFPSPPTFPLQHQQQRQQQQPTTDKAQVSSALETYISRVPSFQDFQAAIEMQLATLTHIQQSSRSATSIKAYSMQCPSIQEDDECVEEYCDDDSESDVGDYDSYDGEDGWRDQESDGHTSDEESVTDPESVRSACSSPVEEEHVKEDYFGVEGQVVKVVS